MNFNRAGGVLLHPTSLPGRYGIGDLGPQAFRFVDWLALTGSRLWQVLPLGPTGYCDSPYQCFSAFAGNPYLIIFDVLIEDGLLTEDDFVSMPKFSSLRVDYGQLIPWKLYILEKAFTRLSSTSESFRQEFDRFSEDNAAWLDDYALFMCIKEANGGGPWSEWKESTRKRERSAMDKARSDSVGSRRHAGKHPPARFDHLDHPLATSQGGDLYPIADRYNISQARSLLQPAAQAAGQLPSLGLDVVKPGLGAYD